MNDLTGIILAGGKSSRMGTEKGLLKIGDKPMICHVIEVLEELGITNILICANDARYGQFNYPVIKDEVKEKGPVGGIYSALLDSTTDKNLFLSCDIPNISVGILQYLLENTGKEMATIVAHKERKHPLIGVYRLGGLETIRKCIESNDLRLTTLCERLEAKILEIPNHIGNERHFLNMNTPQELENSML